MSLYQKLFWLALLTLFLPFYLFRLRSAPSYNIPENTEVRLRGRISKQPYLIGSQQIIYLGPVLIRTKCFPKFFYGQKIEVIGRFEKRVINPFQAQYTTIFPTIRAIQEEKNGFKRFSLTTALIRFRGRVEKAVGELISEPHSSLLLGIVFGVRSQMPEDFRQKLQETGTLHVVVASGQNVAIVIWILTELLTWVVSRKKAIVAALAGMIVYVLMIGAEPPVVRAGIMAAIAYLAQFLGREEEGTIALLFAAGLMLLISPLILFDISFQLSFAATAGLIWLYPLLRGKIFSLPGFGPALATTLAAQLAVMPIIWVYFGRLSLLSLIINGVILWVVPLVMVLGSIMAGFSLIIRPLAQALSFFVWLLLEYFVRVIEVSGRIPGVSLEANELSVWWLVGYYVALALLVATAKRLFRKAI